MPRVRKIVSLVFILVAALSPASGQLNTTEMAELRDGLIRLRQACLDSLHTSLTYLPVMRQTIEKANITALERSRLMHYFLGETSSLNEADFSRSRRGRGAFINVSTADFNQFHVSLPENFEFGYEKFERLLDLKLKQVWPRTLLNSLATYDQLEKEYPHKITGSNYFYGILSFLDYKNNESIAVVSDENKAGVFSMIMGVYLKNAKIYTYDDSPYFLPNLFKGRTDEILAENTSFHPLPREAFFFPKKNKLEKTKRKRILPITDRQDKFVVIDIYQAYQEKKYLRRLYHTLKDDGELYLIETSKGLIRNDIRIEYLLPKGKIKRLAKRAGFELVGREDLKVIRLFKFRKIPGKNFKI